ncbi:MAG: PqiC family protein [Candidatus Thiodiazotropha sp.]
MSAGVVRLWGVVVASMVVVTGCASPSQPTRFYRLDGAVTSEQMIDLKPQPGLVRIGIAPVEVAGYLDRPQMIERQTTHRLELYEFDQWAGSLQENLLSLVSDQLQLQLRNMQVITYPWPSSMSPDYDLNLFISRFERADGQIVLQGRWSLTRRRSGQIVLMQQTRLKALFRGSGIEASVSAASQVVKRLSEHMAAEIRAYVTVDESTDLSRREPHR